MRIRVITRDIWTVGYIESSGDNLDVFLGALTGKDEKAALGLIELFHNIAQENMPVRNLPVNLCKQIDGPIWEFRKGRLRVLWFYDKGKMIICTHGFFKSTRTTPNKEKKRARECYEQYQKSKSDIEFIAEDD